MTHGDLDVRRPLTDQAVYMVVTEGIVTVGLFLVVAVGVRMSGMAMRVPLMMMRATVRGGGSMRVVLAGTCPLHPVQSTVSQAETQGLHCNQRGGGECSHDSQQTCVRRSPNS